MEEFWKTVVSKWVKNRKGSKDVVPTEIDDRIGQLFTENTYAKPITDLIIGHIDSKDLQKVCLVNQYCKKLCDQVFSLRAQDNFGTSNFYLRKIVKLEVSNNLEDQFYYYLRSPSSFFSCSSSVILTSFSRQDVYLISPKTLKTIAHIKSEKHIQKIPNTESLFSFYLEDSLLILAFGFCTMFKHNSGPARTKFVGIDTKTGNTTFTCSWPFSSRIHSFVYNSVSNTIIAVVLPAGSEQFSVYVYHIETNKTTSIPLSSEVSDFEIDSLLFCDEENYFHNKESWSNSFVSKYKNKLVWQNQVRKALSPYEEIARLQCEMAITGPAIRPSYSETPFYCIHKKKEGKAVTGFYLCELDYTNREVKGSVVQIKLQLK